MTATTVREPLLQSVVEALEDLATVVDATPSAYSTSHTIYDLVVDMDGGRRQLVLKDLSPTGLLPEAQGRRPEAAGDPTREVTVYRSVLAGKGLGTARCFASRSDDASGEHWLVLEKVPGVELYQVGELETWAHAATHLARLHDALSPLAERAVPLPVLDGSYFAGWWSRAALFHNESEPGRRQALAWLVGHQAAVVDELAELPVTVIHGDCSASNVLVDRRSGRVCPVDWEMASVGPALLDLAALTAGWPAEKAAQIADAYFVALGLEQHARARFEASLDRCRLQLHMQWLGWAPGWIPPAEHRQDSLAEAVSLAERLGV